MKFLAFAFGLTLSSTMAFANTYKLVVLSAGQISKFETSLVNVDCDGVWGEGRPGVSYRKTSEGYECVAGHDCNYAPLITLKMNINQYYYIQKNIGVFGQGLPYQGVLLNRKCREESLDRYSDFAGSLLNQFDEINSGLINKGIDRKCSTTEALLTVDPKTDEVKNLGFRSKLVKCP